MVTDDVVSDANSSLDTIEEKKEESRFDKFINEIQNLEGNEEKIAFGINFMKEALSKEAMPDFRGFWEAQKVCLALFKEPINNAVRGNLWESYREISNEARRLKAHFEEESSFAAEQIELAVDAAQKDLRQYEDLVLQTPCLLISKNVQAELGDISFYRDLQRELTLLNAFAGRINSLRKEIIKTSMRVRFRSKFFKTLSGLGNIVFPKRKELIKTLSDRFLDDIARFVQNNNKPGQKPLFIVRDQIKELQNLAKQLTLSTQAFTATRALLSEGWDRVREMEKERKKELQEQKEALQGNFQQAAIKIEAFAAACAGYDNLQQAGNEEQEILNLMRSLALHRDDIKELKERLNKAKELLTVKEEQVREIRRQETLAVEEAKKKQARDLKTGIRDLQKKSAMLPHNELLAEYAELKRQFNEQAFDPLEKQELQQIFFNIGDMLQQKSEERLIMQEGENGAALLKVLEARAGKRREIKGRLEDYRKKLGGGGFDFKKAMLLRELVDQEKARLEQADLAIEDIKRQIAAIEG